MKYIVVADSHVQRQPMMNLLYDIHHMDGVAALIHLGDVVYDADWFRERLDIPVYGVPGNCDQVFGAESEAVLTLEGVRIMICHGHRHHVKASLDALSYRAEELGVKAALFGHTHMKCMIKVNGILLVNPGALADGRYAVMELKDGGVASVTFDET